MSIMPFALAFLLPLFSSAAPAAAPAWSADWEAARAASQRECRPLLVEIGAPWCDACRAMDVGPLASARFKTLSERMILLRADAQGGEGRSLQKRYLAPFMPTYLFLGPDGRELGRMVGRQPERPFLARLASWLKKSQEAACKPSPSQI
jgi:thiol:disulfide interchange protein